MRQRGQQGRLFARVAHEKLAYNEGQAIGRTVCSAVYQLECADPDHKGVDAGAAAQAGAFDVQERGCAETGAALQPVGGVEVCQNRRIALQEVGESGFFARGMKGSRLDAFLLERGAMPGDEIAAAGVVFDNFARFQRFDGRALGLRIGRWLLG